jgi:hypothetical protein
MVTLAMVLRKKGQAFLRSRLGTSNGAAGLARMLQMAGLTGHLQRVMIAAYHEDS